MADATVDEVYKALDRLLARQERIEKKLAKLHLKEGGQVLCDLAVSEGGFSNPPFSNRTNQDGGLENPPSETAKAASTRRRTYK